MPLETSRRGFLTAAGAAGLLAASSPPAQALESENLEGETHELQSQRRLATITALLGEELEVQVEDSHETLRAIPRYFGGWQHQIGDRVFVVEEPGDPPAVQPLVKPVDAPLPVSVEKGRTIWLGDVAARITTDNVVESAKQIRVEGTPGLCHWLLVENAQTGEYRVFGVVNRHGSRPPHP